MERAARRHQKVEHRGQHTDHDQRQQEHRPGLAGEQRGGLG
eukprot:gene28101-34905_t